MSDQEFQPSQELQHSKEVYEERESLLKKLQESDEFVTRQMNDIRFAIRVAEVSEKLQENNRRRSERIGDLEAQEVLHAQEQASIAAAIEYQATIADLEQKLAELEHKPMAVRAVVEHFREELQQLRTKPAVDTDLAHGLALLAAQQENTESQALQSDPGRELEPEQKLDQAATIENSPEVGSSKPEWWEKQHSDALRYKGNNLTLLQMFLENPDFVFTSAADQKLHGNKQSVWSAKYVFREVFLPKFHLHSVDLQIRPLTFSITAEEGFDKNKILEAISAHLAEFPPTQNRRSEIGAVVVDGLADAPLFEEEQESEAHGIDVPELPVPEVDTSLVEQAGITKERVVIAATYLYNEMKKLEELCRTPQEAKELGNELTAVVQKLVDQQFNGSSTDLDQERRQAITGISYILSEQQSNAELLQQLEDAGWLPFFFFVSELNDKAAAALNMNAVSGENPLITFLQKKQNGKTGVYDNKSSFVLTTEEVNERVGKPSQESIESIDSQIDEVSQDEPVQHKGLLQRLFNSVFGGDSDAQESTEQASDQAKSNALDTPLSTDTETVVPQESPATELPSITAAPELSAMESLPAEQEKNGLENSAMTETITLLKTFARGKDAYGFFSLQAFYNSGSTGGKVPLDEQLISIQKHLPDDALFKVGNVPQFTIPALGVMYFADKYRKEWNKLVAQSSGEKRAVKKLYAQFVGSLLY